MDETPHEATKLHDELEQIEGIPTVDGRGLHDVSTTEIDVDTEPAVVGHIVGVITDAEVELPGRSDDEPAREVRVALYEHENDTSHFEISGCGIGWHEGYVRLWPGDQRHPLAFDGPAYSRDLAYVAEGCLVVIDGSTEIRAGTTGSNGE